MSEFTWEQEFSFLNENLPEAPDVSKFFEAMNSINVEMERVRNYFNTNLYLSNEPKVIIKIPSTPYQKNKFNENFTFAFQSLVTGRKSSFIKLSDRDKLGIKETDKLKGGIYPTEMVFCDNLNSWETHYSNMLRLLFQKRSEFLHDYYTKISEAKQEWRDLYHRYLCSDEWKQKREQRLLIDNYKCFFNYSKGCDAVNLQIHHIHYNNIGNEKMEDLVTLCINCHAEIHKRIL
jgi:hypothetical protein